MSGSARSGPGVAQACLDPADQRSYEEKLELALRDAGVERMVHFEVEDKAMERRLRQFAAGHGLKHAELRSPMFTCTRQDFADWNSGRARPFMQEFYKFQRKRLGILVDKDGEPAGGRWSFDAENRKKLPKKVVPPEIPWPGQGKHVEDVIQLVATTFPDHPGRAAEFRLELERLGANATVRRNRGTDIDAACGQLRAHALVQIEDARPGQPPTA